MHLMVICTLSIFYFLCASNGIDMKKTFTLLSLLVSGMAAFAQSPGTGAANPTANQADVISLFSGVYTNVPVNTWRTDWSSSEFKDTTIDGNDMKLYYNLTFVGIETVGANLIDASQMTHFNLDFWSGNSTVFKVKLVDFGADGQYAGGDDTEHELTFNAPAQNQWVNFKLPLADFVNLTNKQHIAQIIFVSEPVGSARIFLDNIYFSKGAGLPVPAVAAANPTDDAANVISMFSDAFTNVPVNTWRTDWSSATLTDMDISGNNVKKYSALDFVGIETTGANLIDASQMTHFNLNVWSPNFTTFKIKLVDWGADKAFGGGDDTEHELTFESPAKEEWVKYKIPLTDFTGLASKSQLAQYILVGAPTGLTTIYIDNMYFSKEGTGSTSLNAAAANIGVYPNPASKTLNIDLSQNQAQVNEIRLLDLQGRVVNSVQVNGSSLYTFDVETLVPGLYVVQMNGEQGTFTQKVMVK